MFKVTEIPETVRNSFIAKTSCAPSDKTSTMTTQRALSQCNRSQLQKFVPRRATVFVLLIVYLLYRQSQEMTIALRYNSKESVQLEIFFRPQESQEDLHEEVNEDEYEEDEDEEDSVFIISPDQNAELLEDQDALQDRIAQDFAKHFGKDYYQWRKQFGAAQARASATRTTTTAAADGQKPRHDRPDLRQSNRPNENAKLSIRNPMKGHDPFGRRRRRPFVKHGSSNLDSLTVIGERHSGTTFLTNVMLSCFPTLNVRDVLLSHKHWFQANPLYIKRMAEKYGKDGLGPSSSGRWTRQTWWSIGNHPEPRTVLNTTMVIVMFRDPYDWMEGMRRKPHHWPSHVQYAQLSPAADEKARQLLRKMTRKDLKEMVKERRKKGRRPEDRIWATSRERWEKAKGPGVNISALEWREFVKRPLTVGETESENGRICQKGAEPGRISPCRRTVRYSPKGYLDAFPGRNRAPPNLRLGANDPVYELRKDGTVFSHPLELRAAKIHNFLAIEKHWDVGFFVPLRYERVVETGTQMLVDLVARKFDVEPDCIPGNLTAGRHDDDMDPDFLKWITQNTDWEAEALVGYKPRP